MTRRQFQAALAGAGAAGAAAARPNVIFLLTDDLRWDQMGCAGHPVLRTPAMDRLAREGARFKNAFVTTSLCSPSRATFLTGRYAHAHGVTNNSTELRGADLRRTFPYLLWESGYETAYCGKFHMGRSPGPRPGFDYWAVLPGQGEYVNPELNINGKTVKMEGYSARVSTDLALEWLKKPRTKPFCLIVGYKEVHTPLTPPPHLKDLYAGARWEAPEFPASALEGKPGALRNAGGKRRTGERAYRDMLNNWRSVTAADEQIGRVLAYLDESRQTEDTIVVFAGDNGFFHGEFGLTNKRYAYEPSLRIPLLVRYPRRIRAGRVITETALNLDLCPTLLDFAGAGAAAAHGESWRPLLEGRAARWRTSFVYEYWKEERGTYGQPMANPPPTMRAIRTEQFKYIEYPEGGGEPELYDIQADPNEWRNLAKEPARRSLAEQLKRDLERTIRETS